MPHAPCPMLYLGPSVDALWPVELLLHQHFTLFLHWSYASRVNYALLPDKSHLPDIMHLPVADPMQTVENGLPA